MDIVTPATRSRMMSGIRGKNTRPEIVVRKGLFAMGFRFRLHSPDLPGKPDIVLPKYRTVIFINGCFWHGHDCPLFKWPSTRPGFWRNKIEGNRANDLKKDRMLHERGWRILTVWECSIKGPGSRQRAAVIREIADWIRGTGLHGEIGGAETGMDANHTGKPNEVETQMCR
jgi:DNA mismatch endonuclease (patch repair protein)